MPMSTEELAKRVKADHLTDGGLAEEVKKAAEAPPPEKTPETDPRLQKVYTFEFRWTDGRGKKWTGTFTNHILNIREQEMVGQMAARLRGGLSYDAMDAYTNELNLMLAHLTFSLEMRDRPDWAKDLGEIDNVELLQALYAEVDLHQRTFRGR